MTRVVRVDPLDPREEDLREAVDLLKGGEVVIFPTETVYGLGADVFNERACRKIFELKKRPLDNPLIVHIDSFEQLFKIAKVQDRYLHILERFWPGPLTVVLEKKNVVSDVVTAGLRTVAVRMPAHPVALKLIGLLGSPIAAPSANVSGRPSATSVEHVLEDFMGKVKLVIDAGPTPFGLESTVVDLTKSPPVLLRPGPVEVEKLVEIFEGLIVPDFVREKKGFSGVPPSPGVKYRHYAPSKPLVLVEDLNKMPQVLKEHPNSVVLCVRERSHLYEEPLVLGSLENPYSIAQNLFRALREAEKMVGKEWIVVEGFEEKGILFAVMNRLRKAATEIVR